MPSVLTETQYPLDPPRKLWTRAECRTLESSGLFDW